MSKTPTIRQTLLMIRKAILNFQLYPQELPATLKPIEPKTDIKTAELVFWNWYDFMIGISGENLQKLNELENIFGGQRTMLTMYLQGELPIIDLAGECWEAVRSDFEKCGVSLPAGASAKDIEIPFGPRRQIVLV